MPVIGLAIDGAIVLWQKARLSSSVDAAAYAAGRSLSIGATVAAAQAAAATTATTYFKANFPDGTLGSTSQVSPSIPPPNNGLWTISVDAKANVPLYFLRLLGISSSNLAAHAQVSRRNVNIIMVLDRSASLVIYNSGGCPSLISAAQNFTNLFVAGQDNLGLITFQTTANLDFPPGLDFKSRVTTLSSGTTAVGMAQLIGQLQCEGYTNTVAALNLAYNQIKAINQPSALNVIVFFSDGKPDAITAAFSPKLADTRDSIYSPFSAGPSPASTCSGSSPVTGVLVAMDENPDPTASTLGLLPAPTSPSGGDPINSVGIGPWGLTPNAITNTSTAGCNYVTSGAAIWANGWCYNGSCNARNDIAYIPWLDINNNSTSTSYRPLTAANYGLFPLGSGPYAGWIRSDTPSGVVNASLNAAFQQVLAIRNDTQFKPILYSIGLGGYIDTGFMQDVANDPAAPNYSATSPQGQYIYAPTGGQLSAAFQQIASQVLRFNQ